MFLGNRSYGETHGYIFADQGAYRAFMDTWVGFGELAAVYFPEQLHTYFYRDTHALT